MRKSIFHLLIVRQLSLTHTSLIKEEGLRQRGGEGGRSEDLRDPCPALPQRFIDDGCGALVVTAVNVVLLFLSFEFRDFQAVAVFVHIFVVMVRNGLFLGCYDAHDVCGAAVVLDASR